MISTQEAVLIELVRVNTLNMAAIYIENYIQHNGFLSDEAGNVVKNYLRRKWMEFEDFLFGLLENTIRTVQASEVSAKYVPGKGTIISIDGKGSDVTILSLIIARRIILDSPTSIEQYCEMLKQAVAKDMENELEDTKDIFIDVCVKN